MIVVTYPMGTGGVFVGGLISKIVHNSDLPGISTYGGILFDVVPRPVTYIHEPDIIKVVESHPGSKIVCISIDSNDYKVQEKNFLTKCIPELWKEDWYQDYKSDSYPEFNPDLSKMPEWVIQDILRVNQEFIKNWSYILPDDMSNVLMLNFKDIMSGDTLLEKLKTFFNVHEIDNSVYKFISDYQALQ